MKKLENMSCGEWLRTLGLFSLEEKRLRGDHISLCRFLRSGDEGAVSFLWDTVIRQVCMVQNSDRGISDWTLGSNFLPRGW